MNEKMEESQVSSAKATVVFSEKTKPISHLKGVLNDIPLDKLKFA
jgi:hypothetical protein